MYYIWNLVINAQALQCFLSLNFHENFCKFLHIIAHNIRCPELPQWIFNQNFQRLFWTSNLRKPVIYCLKWFLCWILIIHHHSLHWEQSNYAKTSIQILLNLLSRITPKLGVIRDSLLRQNSSLCIELCYVKKLIYNLESIADLYLWVLVRGYAYKSFYSYNYVKNCPELPQLTVPLLIMGIM